MQKFHTLLLAGGLGAAALLGACSDSSSPGGDNLSSVEANDAALAQVDETQDMTDALSLDGQVNPASLSTASTLRPSFNLFGPPEAGCATISSLVDADNDGTPDDAIFTYALPACHFTGYLGSTLDLTGQVTVQDPTPDAADLNRAVTLADFTYAFTSPIDRSFTSVRNGTRNLTGSATNITLNNNVTIHRSVPSKPLATIVHNLQAVFTPEAGSTITAGNPLPNGTIVVTGQLTWSRDGRSHVFTVTTPVPLVYDASCSGPRRERVSSGEIHWTLPSGKIIITTWTACGVPPTHQVVLPA